MEVTILSPHYTFNTHKRKGESWVGHPEADGTDKRLP